MSSVFVEHGEGVYRLYIKGAAERIIKDSSYYAVSTGGNSLDDVECKEFDEGEKQKVVNTTEKFTNNGLRCLGLGYRKLKHDEIEWHKNPDSGRIEPHPDFVINKDIVLLG